MVHKPRRQRNYLVVAVEPMIESQGVAEVQPGRRWRGARRADWLLGAVLGLTVAHWIVLVFHLPLFTKIPGWFFPLQNNPAGSVWSFGLLAAMAAAGIYFVLRCRPAWLAVVGLVLLGFLIQTGFAFLEGRGTDAFRRVILADGHGIFLPTATREPSILDVMTRYEEKLQTGELPNYSHSKPAGTMVFYMLSERLANVIRPHDTFEERLEWYRTFACWFWPALSCLAVVPIYCFARLFARDEVARRAAVLYLLVPSIELIVMHTDPIFYVTMTTLSVLLVALSFARRSILLAVLAGVVFYLTLYCSFGMAVVVGVGAGAAFPLLPRREDGRWDWPRAVTLSACVALAFVAVDLVFRLALNYDMFARFQRILAFHQSWNQWHWNWYHVLGAPVLNLTEFLVWTGVPIIILGAAHVVRSARGLARRDFRPMLFLSASWGLVIAFLATFGMTKGEVSRAWMFMLPYLCLFGADELHSRFGRRRTWVFWAVVALQLVTIWLTKIHLQR